MDSRSLVWIWSIKDCFVWISDLNEDCVSESRVDNAEKEVSGCFKGAK